MKILLFIGVVVAFSVLMYLIGYIIFMLWFRRAKDIGKIEEKTLKKFRKNGYGNVADCIKTNKKWFDDTEHSEVYINSFDDLKLYARFYANPDHCGQTAIMLHGYHSSVEFDFGAVCQFLYSMGMNILAVDQRAHGKSEGEYISLGVAERIDALSWADWVADYCGENEGIIIYGASMGATTALLAVGEGNLNQNVIGVVADSGYIGPWMQIASTMRKSHIPSNPFVNIVEIMCMMKGRFAIKDYTTTNSLLNAMAPVLFITGDKDDIVSPDDSRINCEQCASRSELLVIPGAGHCMAYLTDEDRCRETIRAFMESLEGPPSPEREHRLVHKDSADDEYEEDDEYDEYKEYEEDEDTVNG